MKEFPWSLPYKLELRIIAMDPNTYKKRLTKTKDFKVKELKKLLEEEMEELTNPGRGSFKENIPTLAQETSKSVIDSYDITLWADMDSRVLKNLSSDHLEVPFFKKEHYKTKKPVRTQVRMELDADTDSNLVTDSLTQGAAKITLKSIQPKIKKHVEQSSKENNIKV